MCGVLGIFATTPVNQMLYDGLLLLQHRGQDAAGIATYDDQRLYMHKNNGLVKDVFHTRHMRNLLGNMGIAHARYPTAGSSSVAEAQPFYVNSPLGIVLSHNGNLINTQQLKNYVFKQDWRHINTTSDSEVLLNVLAHQIATALPGFKSRSDILFEAVSQVHQHCQGAYAVIALIAGFGLLAFRDAYGIRPLIIGKRESSAGIEYAIASESVAFEPLGFELWRDVAPGEAIYIDFQGHFASYQCALNPTLNPCIFEYVYFARPDSVMDGISVYEARLQMGATLVEKIQRDWSHLKVDVVIPIPDTSRPIALELAHGLKLPYREGFVKNRYIGRTFIMPGQALRKKSVRQKLNPIRREFAGRNVLLVDDSIVRGTTSQEIVQMAREAGARSVYLASAAPPVLHQNVYGIDMPSSNELLAVGKSESEICYAIGADAVIYQNLQALITSVGQLNPQIQRFDCSCFDGQYVTQNVSEEYLYAVSALRGQQCADTPSNIAIQMDLALSSDEVEDDEYTPISP